MNSRCEWCDDHGWVCEEHSDRPWAEQSERFDACDCGGAGAPCPHCNADVHKTGMKYIIADKDRYMH